MADLNGIDMSFISKKLVNDVEGIKQMEGEAAKVDSKKEYEALKDMLSTGKLTSEQAKYVEAHMQEYKEYEAEQQKKEAQQKEQDFLDRVSDRAKEYVKQVMKMFGNAEKIDEKAEAGALISALNDDRYSEDDKEYFRRALQESDVCCDKEQTPTEKPKFGVHGNDNTNPAPKPTKPTPKPTKPTPKPTKPTPVPNPEPDDVAGLEPHTVTIKEKDRIEGNKLGAELAKEINSSYTDNRRVGDLLKDVKPENAYNFFKNYNSEHEGYDSIVKNVLNDTSDKFNKLTLADVVKPIENLLAQATEIGLQDTWEFQNLQNRLNYLETKIDNNGSNVDPTERESMRVDNAINLLLDVMGKYVE